MKSVSFVACPLQSYKIRDQSEMCLKYSPEHRNDSWEYRFKNSSAVYIILYGFRPFL